MRRSTVTTRPRRRSPGSKLPGSGWKTSLKQRPPGMKYSWRVLIDCCHSLLCFGLFSCLFLCLSVCLSVCLSFWITHKVSVGFWGNLRVETPVDWLTRLWGQWPGSPKIEIYDWQIEPQWSCHYSSTITHWCHSRPEMSLKTFDGIFCWKLATVPEMPFWQPGDSESLAHSDTFWHGCQLW